jgi:hypothetical protein
LAIQWRLSARVYIKFVGQEFVVLETINSPAEKCNRQAKDNTSAAKSNLAAEFVVLSTDDSAGERNNRLPSCQIIVLE